MINEQTLLRQRNAISEFSELALRSSCLETVLDEACRLISQALEAPRAKYLEYHPDQGAFWVRSGIGWDNGIVGELHITVEEGTPEWYTLLTKSPVISAERAKEERFVYHKFMVDHGSQSFLSVPVFSTDSEVPVGILQIDLDAPSSFSEADIDFLQGYANLIGAAIVRLKLSEQEHDLREVLQARLSNKLYRLKKEQHERELAESKLRQSQKMEALGQLTGGIAHDFNNFLATISSSLELLRLRVSTNRTDSIGRYVDLAEGATKRAASLTHRLLSFARQQSLKPELISPASVIEGLRDLLRSVLGAGIDLSFDLEAGDYILCDLNQLENAVMNLCINARDAMPEGGVLTISVRQTLIQEDLSAPFNLPAGTYVAVVVSDNGVGMPPDVARRAFDPFFTTKQPNSGTGLGLSMVYGFCLQSNGYVDVSSQEGVGTQFTMYFPSEKRADTSAPVIKPSENYPKGKGEVILLVDDELGVRQMAAELLVDLGYIVMQATNADAALKKAELMSRLDLLVTGVGLAGGIDGVELAKRLKKARPDIKVLFTTGYAQRDEKELNELGTLCLKPFTLADIAKQIRSLL